MISALVGRTTELQRLDELAGTPLVTLWGPGGAGKTRLAREHAARLAARGRRVVFVDLAAARSRDDALAALAAGLGVTLDDDAVAVLARAAAAQRALLVADNAEQLDADARAVIVALATPETPVLATSREALGAEGEVLVAVASLAPDEALALFVAVANAADADREVARAIVARLDALPLAIELAAARASMLGASALHERLDQKLDVLASSTRGLPERHATLRATIAWSWDLLDDRERSALVACATFAAGFDAALAEGVIGGPDALDRIDRLVARALVNVGPAAGGGRELHLAESVRDFARERLAEHAERDTIAARYAEAVVERAEAPAERIRRGGDGQGALLAHRADLVRIAAAGGPLAARATLALATLLLVTGPVGAVVERTRQARATCTDSAIAARLAVVEAEALRASGALDEARKAANAALAHAPARADAESVLGSIARSLGDTDAALAHEERALAMHREHGDEARAGICIGRIGAVHQTAGRLGLARERHAEAIAMLVATKARRAEGVERSFLAVATHRSGAVREAIALHEAALAIHRETGHVRLEGAELLHLAFVRHELGDAEASRADFAAAREALAKAGATGLYAMACVLAARLEVDAGELTAAELALAEAARIAPASWPRLHAMLRLVRGHLAFARGDAEAARDAFAAAASSTVEVGFEAVTPAWLALATMRASSMHRDDAVGLLEASRAKLAAVENPHLAHAHAVIAAGVLGSAPPRVPDTAAACSSEVRRALAHAGARRPLSLDREGRRLVLPDGRAVDLGKRKNVVRILSALFMERMEHPGRALPFEALLEAGWPGERMRPDAATKRLHTAIWTLRTLGLEGILRTEEAGYLLDPSVAVERE